MGARGGMRGRRYIHPKVKKSEVIIGGLVSRYNNETLCF